MHSISLQLWAKDTKPQKAPPQDIEIEEYTWGIGSHVITTLINVEGEVGAWDYSNKKYLTTTWNLNHMIYYIERVRLASAGLKLLKLHTLSVASVYGKQYPLGGSPQVD